MWFINCRSAAVVGDVYPVRVTDGALTYTAFPELLSAVRGQHVLIGVHGFNVNQAGAIDHLQEWNKLLCLGASTVFVGGLWPGDSCWLGAMEYAFAAKAAMLSINAFASFLNSNFSQASSVSFVSHSLGARVVLQTIQ
jgi:esterase/lipase superfamily enzyme